MEVLLWRMRGFADHGHEDAWGLETKNLDLICHFSVGHTRPDVKVETLCGWIGFGLYGAHGAEVEGIWNARGSARKWCEKLTVSNGA